MNYYGEVLRSYFPDLPYLDNILEESPLLRRMKAQESNAGEKHMYDELIEAEALKQTNYNEAYDEITARFGESYAEVNRFAGKHYVTQDTVLKIAQAKGRSGSIGFGINEYFRQKRAAIATKTANEFDQSVYYAKNGILSRAKSFGNVSEVQTSGSDFYSLAVVGNNDHSSLIYDSAFYGGENGAFIKEQNLNAVNNGEIVPTEDSGGVFVYGKAMQSSIGNFFVDERQLSAIVNFKLTDIDADFFQLVNDAIVKVRSMDKFIVAHPYVIARLKQAEEAKRGGVGNVPTGYTGNDNNVHMGIWDTVGMVGDYNLSEGLEVLDGGLS